MTEFVPGDQVVTDKGTTGTVLVADAHEQKPDHERHAKVAWEAGVPAMWVRYTSISKLEDKK